MAEAPQPIVPERPQRFAEYDQQRRLNLNRIILPLYMAVDLLGILAIVFTPTGAAYAQLGGLYPVEVGISVALLVLMFVAYMATRRQMVVLGTNLGVIAVVLTISSTQVFNLLGGEHGTFIDIVLFTAFGVAIVMAGGVGGRTAVLATTIWMNLVTVASLVYVLMTTPANLAVHQQASTLIVQELIYQWAFAGLMLGVLAGYQRMIGDLGDLRTRVERARQVDDLKDQFISSVNHELRNPIMAMQGYHELLLRGIQRQRPYAELEEMARTTDRINDDLAALVQSILEIRRDLSAQPYTPVPVLVTETLKKAVQFIDPRETKLTEREIQLRIPAELAIWGDPIRLQQIFTNLLSNAVKYSLAGTPIEVTAELVAGGERRRGGRAAPSHPEAEIRVRDYGHGVPPAQIPLLFQRFVRLPRDLHSPVIGNGLGLYVCRTLATSMGGRIWVESTGVAGEGSTFFLRLPLPPVP